MSNKICTHTNVGVTLSVLGGKWKPLILWHIREKPLRFNQLKKSIIGITQKMLTQQLRELQKDQLVKRTAKAVVPPHVEYSLTQYGKSLEPVLKVMNNWGENHAKRLRLVGPKNSK